MNKLVAKLEPESEVSDPLALLRAPFPPNQISKLPKPYKADSPKGKCTECGGYHGLPAVHLDYVGHAALTDRLLDTDPHWSWEPMGFAQDGTPAFDANGGMWIKLTVCGITRIGYGNAPGKKGGDAVKEVIGDALRNAAMRFGAALDLWHKGDLHVEEQEPVATLEERAMSHLKSCAISKDAFSDAWGANKDGWKATLDGPSYARLVSEMKRLAGAFPKEPEPSPADFGISDDDIPESFR